MKGVWARRISVSVENLLNPFRSVYILNEYFDNTDKYVDLLNELYILKEVKRLRPQRAKAVWAEVIHTPKLGSAYKKWNPFHSFYRFSLPQSCPRTALGALLQLDDLRRHGVQGHRPLSLQHNLHARSAVISCVKCMVLQTLNISVVIWTRISAVRVRHFISGYI